MVYPRSYPYPAEQCYYPNDILVEVHRAEDPAGREFVVQDVLDHRGEGSARQYMVKFLVGTFPSSAQSKILICHNL